MNSIQRYSRLILVGAIASVSLLSISPNTEARSLGRPQGNSSTGAVRGACNAPRGTNNRQLKALVDKTSPALTTQARPTFWFYLPFTRSEEVTTVQFELLDENQNPVLKAKTLAFAMPDKPGIVSLTIPTSEQALAVDKEYFWVFHVVCDENDFSANPSVSGWIKRVAPSSAIVRQLKSTPTQQQYNIYANNKIWFEQISLLAEYRTKQMQNWTTLLNQFGLKDFAQTEPIKLSPAMKTP